VEVMNFQKPKNERLTMKNGKLNGKVAVVTGASKGIGAGIAKEFAAEGASVVVNYASSKSDADKVVDEITKRGGKAIAVQGNVAKKADVERLFAGAKKSFGKIDILVNNAGVYDFKPLEEITEEEKSHRHLLLETYEQRFGPNSMSAIMQSFVSKTAAWAFLKPNCVGFSNRSIGGAGRRKKAPGSDHP